MNTGPTTYAHIANPSKARSIANHNLLRLPASGAYPICGYRAAKLRGSGRAGLVGMQSDIKGGESSFFFKSPSNRVTVSRDDPIICAISS